MRLLRDQLLTAFPDVWTTLMKHFADPTFPSPTTALRFSANDDANATLRGEKYKVETVSTTLLEVIHSI